MSWDYNQHGNYSRPPFTTLIEYLEMTYIPSLSDLADNDDKIVEIPLLRKDH